MGVNFYELLGVPRTASTAEIESAFRKVSKAYHPDAGSPIANSTLFREVTEARNTLKDITRRRLYDELLDERPSPRNDDDPVPPATPSYGRSRSEPDETLTRRYFTSRSPRLLVLAIVALIVGHWMGSQPNLALVAGVGRLSTTLAQYSVLAYLVVPKSKVRASFSGIRRFVSGCRAKIAAKPTARSRRT